MLASATTGTASWPRPTSTTSAGRSGSFWSCSTPGSTPQAQQRPADRRAADSARRAGRRATDAVRRYQDEHRLAYQSEAPVNWCPALGTVLANEEVIGGVSERGGHPVVRHAAAAVDAADHGLCRPAGERSGRRRLAREHQGAAAQLDRPQHGRRGRFFHRPRAGARRQAEPAGVQSLAQRAGRQRAFRASPGDDVLRVFTTRPDTLYRRHVHGRRAGASAGRAADHSPAQAAAVEAYCEQAARKSDLDRTDLAKEKTGVFTGSFAANPVNNRPVPIWVADYVLASYGTGAIMAVPAHDTRDFEFARQFELEHRAGGRSGRRASTAAEREEVLAGRAVFTGHGTAINSGPYDGQSTAEMQKKIVADLAKRGQGRAAVNYKLRDWLFSRQHFWGEPFPILHELDADGQPTGLVRTVPPDELPVDLPELRSFDSHGSPDPPLEQAPADWLYVDDRRPALQARNQHHAPMGRLVLVLPAVSRSQERAGVRRSRRSNGPGCRSICISAAPSMPCCTCSTPASGTRCSSIAATSARPSRSTSWSTRE